MTEQKPPEDSVGPEDRFDTAFLNRGNPPQKKSSLEQIRERLGPTVNELAKKQQQEREQKEAETAREAESLARMDRLLADWDERTGTKPEVTVLPQAIVPIVQEPQKEKEPWSIDCAQHLYTLANFGNSPRGLSGWQTLQYTTEGPLALNKDTISIIEALVGLQDNYTSWKEPKRWRFFQFDKDRVVFTRTVPTNETDRSGRKFIHLDHSLIVSREDLQKLPHGALSLWNDDFYIDSLYELQGDRQVNLPVKKIGSTMTKAEPIDVIPEVLKKKIAGKSAAALQKEFEAENAKGLSSLLTYIVSAKQIEESGKHVVMYGENSEIQKVLQFALQLVHQIPDLDETTLSFSTYQAELDSYPRVFWAVAAKEAPPHHWQDRLLPLDAKAVLADLNTFR